MAKSEKPKRTLADIKEVTLEIDGEELVAYSTEDSAVYVGASVPGLTKRLTKYNEEMKKKGQPEIKRYKNGFQPQVYYLKKDLDILKKPHAIE